MDLKEMKKNGFIAQRQEGLFCLRVKVTGGRVTAEDMLKMAEIANKYGKGHVHLTSRQGVEIPFIKGDDVPEIIQKMKEYGLVPATLGPGIRTISACQGTEVCSSGLINPQELALRLDEKLLGRNEVPHKFKIGLTGCHNNCLKAEEHDIGIKGALIPEYSSPETCIHCGVCQKVCPVGAIEVTKDDLKYDGEKCVHCGRCYNKCPKDCWSGRPAMHVFFGGLFGNTIQSGRPLLGTLTDESQLDQAIEKTLEYFAANGRKGERFGRVLARLGWDHFENFMTCH